MKIEMNGTVRDVADSTTLTTLIESSVGSTRGSAVAVDGEVIPRADWPAYHLHEGQRVELITAVQGG